MIRRAPSLQGLSRLALWGVDPAGNRKAREFLLREAIAHRGLFDEAMTPENSLAAFARAAEAACPVELDVQLTADRELVVFHDQDLFRMTGAAGRVQDSTLAQLKRLRLCQTEQRIPTLAEVLETIGGRSGILVEIKHSAEPALICRKLWQEMRTYQGAWAVESFDPRCVVWFARNAAHIPRGILAQRLTRQNIPLLQKIWVDHLLSNGWTHPNFVAYRIGDLPNKAVAYLRARGLPIIGWTIRTEAELAKAGLYCDNIIFDTLSLAETGNFKKAQQKTPVL